MKKSKSDLIDELNDNNSIYRHINSSDKDKSFAKIISGASFMPI